MARALKTIQTNVVTVTVKNTGEQHSYRLGIRNAEEFARSWKAQGYDVTVGPTEDAADARTIKLQDALRRFNHARTGDYIFETGGDLKWVVVTCAADHVTDVKVVETFDRRDEATALTASIRNGRRHNDARQYSFAVDAKKDIPAQIGVYLARVARHA